MKRFSQIFVGARRYLIAVWTVGAAFLLSLIAEPLVSPGISPLFLLAVLISAWRGGLGAGLLATFLAAFSSAFVFLPPRFSFQIDRGDMLQLAVFTVCAVMMGTLSAARHRSEAARDELFYKEQNARIEAERANQVKDEFLAAVSHELRTPLTTIKTLTRVMQRREMTNEERAEFLADIASECDREIDLVLNLLDLSRIRAGRIQIKLERVELSQVLVACAKIVRGEAEKRDHRLRVEIPSEEILIHTDQSALRRALCAILENAIKFTPDGGSISLRSVVENERAVIEIEDDGRGIPGEDIPHVFEKFYRGQNAGGAPQASPEEVPGIGLGLNLAKILITGMNGTIDVESRLGEGTKFTVQLPLWKEEVNSDSQAAKRNFGALSPNELATIPDKI